MAQECTDVTEKFFKTNNTFQVHDLSYDNPNGTLTLSDDFQLLNQKESTFHVINGVYRYLLEVEESGKRLSATKSFSSAVKNIRVSEGDKFATLPAYVDEDGLALNVLEVKTSLGYIYYVFFYKKNSAGNYVCYLCLGMIKGNYIAGNKYN